MDGHCEAQLSTAPLSAPTHATGACLLAASCRSVGLVGEGSKDEVINRTCSSSGRGGIRELVATAPPPGKLGLFLLH